MFVLKLSSHVTKGSSDKRDTGSVIVRGLLLVERKKAELNKSLINDDVVRFAFKKSIKRMKNNGKL